MHVHRMALLNMVPITTLICFAFALPAKSQDDTSLGQSFSSKVAVTNRSAKALSPETTISADGEDIFTESHPRLILALSGGACKAVAEIGVLRSLEQHHIKIDGIVGTSMGATVGALYCAGVPLNEMEAMFIDGTIQKSMCKGVFWSLLTRPVAPLAHIFKGRPYAGIIDGKGYLRFLERKLPQSFEELKIPFAAVVTDLTDGQTVVLAHGELPRAVLASNCVPTIYRPVAINGKLYVDGGLKANLPADVAEKLGAGIVVAVLVDTAVKPVPNKRFKSKNALILRVMNIMMASSDKMQTRASDTLIYPNVDFIPAITRDPGIISRGIAAGQKAADSAMAQINREVFTLQQMNINKIKPALVQPLVNR